MNQILQDFYDHLNEAVITTNDFEDGTKFRKREKVADFVLQHFWGKSLSASPPHSRRKMMVAYLMVESRR